MVQWKATAERALVASQQAARIAATWGARGARVIARGAQHLWRSAALRRRVVRPLFVTARIGLLAALLAGLTVFAGSALVRRVLPTELAVRQNNWGSRAGVEPRDLGPGFHFGPIGLTSWHILDARTVHLRFGAERDGNVLPPLELRTADDVEFAVSVNVPYRVQEGRAHQLVADGLKSNYKQSAKTAVEKVLLERLATLSAEEWFQTDRRQAVGADALAAVNAALARLHLVAETVLITGVAFPPLYEQKLAEQKLSGQKLETNAVLARRDLAKHELDVEEAAVNREEAELIAAYDLRLERLKLDMESQALAIATETELFRASRKVEADNLHAKALTVGQLAVDQAEALKERLTNEALESAGGRLLLAQEAAAALKIKSITLDAARPDAPNPLDLDGFVRLLVGDGGPRPK